MNVDKLLLFPCVFIFSAQIWNLPTRCCTHTLEGHTDSVYALAAVPGNRLISGSDDNTIKVLQ